MNLFFFLRLHHSVFMSRNGDLRTAAKDIFGDWLQKSTCVRGSRCGSSRSFGAHALHTQLKNEYLSSHFCQVHILQPVIANQTDRFWLICISFSYKVYFADLRNNLAVLMIKIIQLSISDWTGNFVFSSAFVESRDAAGISWCWEIRWDSLPSGHQAESSCYMLS